MQISRGGESGAAIIEGMGPADFDVALRLACPADAPGIASLSRAEVERGLAWRWTPPRVEASILARDVNVLVATVDGRLAGFGIMSYGLEWAHLELFAVQPERRRLGIGRRLLAWLEEPARVGGLSAIWLEVRAGNRPAQAFYERMGYRRLGELPRYYDGRESAIRMGRELGCLDPSSISVIGDLGGMPPR
jgi:ribosomal-protein-alanine N-acetyltransferase